MAAVVHLDLAEPGSGDELRRRVVADRVARHAAPG
jgi:hypothetical protein